jgi:hypothetical protein
VAWVSGTITAADGAGLRVTEPSGPEVQVRLLGSGATTFFVAADGSWTPVDASAVTTGEPACIEALLTAGGAMLALRVFLGAACGPS